MRLAWVVVLGSFGVAHADVDPVMGVDDLAAARGVIAQDATCVPKALRPRFDHDGNIERRGAILQLADVAATPTLCASAGPDPGDTAGKQPIGTLACWEIDVAHRKLRPIAPRLLPGHLVAARLTDRCTHGLCIPKPDPVADREISVGLRDDGKVAVVIVRDPGQLEQTPYVFDRAKRTLLRKGATYSTMDTGDDLALSGDALIGEWCAAGPLCHAQIHDLASDADRDPTDLPGHDSTNTYDGTIALLAPGVLAIADAGWYLFEKLDVKTGKLEAVRKQDSPRCLDSLGATPARCKKLFRRRVDPYAGASIVARGTGYLALLFGPRAGELVMLDRKLDETPGFNVYCKR